MNTEFCRLCANECHIKLLVNIFADEHLHRAIRTKIFSILQINVKIDDTLSRNVCLICLGRLDGVCRFIDECFEAQIRLKKRILDDIQSVQQVRKRTCEESELTETASSKKKPPNIEIPDATDVIDTFPADADDQSSDDDSIDSSHHNVGDISDTQCDNLTGRSAELPPNNLQSQQGCNSMDVQDLCTTTDDEEDCEVVYDNLDLTCTNVASVTSGIVNSSRRTSPTPVNVSVNGNVSTLSVNSPISDDDDADTNGNADDDVISIESDGNGVKSIADEYIVDELSTERQNNNIELIENDETATDINSGDVLLEERELSASSNVVQYVSDYTSDNITSDNGRDDNIRTNKIAFIQDDTSRSGNIRTNEIATCENECGIASVVSPTAVCDQVIDLISDGHSCSSAAPENTTDNCDGNDDENGVNDLLSANIETNVVETCSDSNQNECKSTTLVDFKIMLNNQVFVELCQQYRIVYDNSQPADINNCCIEDNDRSKNKRNSDNSFQYNLRHRKDVKAAVTIDDILFEEYLDDYDLDSLDQDETDSDDSDFIVSANGGDYDEEKEIDCNSSHLSTTATNIDDNTNHSVMDYYYDSRTRGIENRCRSNEFSNIITREKRKSNNNIFNHRTNFLLRPSPTTEQLQRLDLLLPEMKIKSVNAKCNINDILKAVLPSYNFDVNNFEFRFRYDNLKYRLPRNRLILISGSKYVLAAFDTDSMLRMLNERKLNRLFLTLIHNSIVTVTGGSENTPTASSVYENVLSESNISVLRYIEPDKLENIPRIFRSQISSCASDNGILLIRDFHQSDNILSNLASIFNGKKLVICQSCSDGNMYVSFSALKLYNNPTVDQSQKVGGMDNVCDDSRTTELLDHLYVKEYQHLQPVGCYSGSDRKMSSCMTHDRIINQSSLGTNTDIRHKFDRENSSSSTEHCVSQINNNNKQLPPSSSQQSVSVCRYCDKCFICPASLDRHMLNMHSSYRYVLCCICERMIKRVRFYDHTVSVHSSNNTLQLASSDDDVCSLRSNSDKRLCSICKKKFKSTNSLKEHVGSVHSQILIKSSWTSAQEFERSYNRNIHTAGGKTSAVVTTARCRRKIVHNSARCSICEKTFKNRLALEVHISRAHMIKNSIESKKVCLTRTNNNDVDSEKKNLPLISDIVSKFDGHDNRKHTTRSHLQNEIDKSIATETDETDSNESFCSSRCSNECSEKFGNDVIAKPELSNHNNAKETKQSDSSNKSAGYLSSTNETVVTDCHLIDVGIHQDNVRYNSLPACTSSRCNNNQPVRRLLRYSCSYCHKRFTERSNVRRHERNVHNVSECAPSINKTVATTRYSNNTENHQNRARNNTSPTAHASSQINKRTNLNSDVSKKNKVPKSLGEYFCSKCHKQFKYKHSAIRHEQDAHGSLRYKCDICERILKSKDSLRWHMKSCHNKLVKNFQLTAE